MPMLGARPDSFGTLRRTTRCTGMDADIPIFDPETVTDNATPQDGGLPTTGIRYVIVNGIVVVKDSKVLKNVFPGLPIRNEILD